MRKLIRRRPSPAMVVALLALFVAMGTGAAVALPGMNTVNSGDIINGQVKPKDVKDDSLESLDIRDGTIEAIDVAFGTLRGDEILDGTVGGTDIGDDSLSGADINESTLGEVPQATSADNAGSLGGVPAGSYQRECQDGAIKGYALVNGDASFPATYTTGPPGVVESFNCPGGDVFARRVAQGRYNVCFSSQFPSVVYATAIGTGTDAGGEDNLVTWRREPDGACPGGTAAEITIVDEDGNAGVDREDASFSVMLGG